MTLTGAPQLCFDLSQPLPPQRFYRAWQTNGPKPVLDATMATAIPLAGAIGNSVRVDYINQFGPTDAWVTLDTVVLTNTTQLYSNFTKTSPRLSSPPGAIASWRSRDALLRFVSELGVRPTFVRFSGIILLRVIQACAGVQNRAVSDDPDLKPFWASMGGTRWRRAD